MRLPMMTMRRWMVVVAVFAASLRGGMNLFGVVSARSTESLARCVKASLEGALPGTCPVIYLDRDAEYWIKVDARLRPLRFLPVIVAAACAFGAALLFPAGKARSAQSAASSHRR
jgi:hypothetical protein